MCFEAAALIGADMIHHRGESSYIVGPSVANQRIENHWNQIWSKFASYFKGLFQQMERDGDLDRHNPSDIFSLTQAFHKHMQERLLQVCHDWNYHTVRSQITRGIHGYVPAHVFERGVRQLSRLSMAEIEAVAEGVADELGSSETATSYASSPACDFPERVLPPTYLQDPLSTSSEKGVRAAVLRQLDPDSYAAVQTPQQCVHSFILHRQVSVAIVQLRDFAEGHSFQWQHYMDSMAQSGPLAVECAGEIQYVIENRLY